uniref:PiggyBac transposable element-derived protein domain-containing protein n=1 Tax=Strigamia maritima TaxID=126957 RepID=T1IY01_STRMM
MARRSERIMQKQMLSNPNFSDSEYDDDDDDSDPNDEEECSVVDALSDDEVDNVEIQEDSSEDEGESDDAENYVARDETIWTSAINNQVRRQSSNIITVRPGPTAGISKTKIGLFESFMNPYICHTIISKTNTFAEESFRIHNIKHNTNLAWKSTDEIELRAFFGLLLLAGVERHKKTSIKQLWTQSAVFGRPIFPATMARNRFCDLLKYLRFDDAFDRHEKKKQNISVSKLAPIQDVFDNFVSILTTLYEPAENITVDKMLVKFRGRCIFRVYMKSNLADMG